MLKDKELFYNNFIIGAGISGLSLAYYLRNTELTNCIVDSAPHVGGNCRTIVDGDFRFDIGGHRFYSKNKEVLNDVKDLIGEDLLVVGRKSSIYVNGRYVNYPLEFWSSFRAYHPLKAVHVFLNYIFTRLTFKKKPVTFEDWVIKTFGSEMYKTFFKSYSEKVWGIECHKLTADFAMERIRTLTLWKAIKDIVVKNKTEVSIIKQFFYPRYGFGMIPERLHEGLKNNDIVKTTNTYREIFHDGKKFKKAILEDGSTVSFDNLISSIDYDSVLSKLNPQPPLSILEAARRLRFRDLIVVNLQIDKEKISDNLWIYFPSNEKTISRIHEPKNWSENMGPKGFTSLVVELFCFENDELWNLSDEAILNICLKDLVEANCLENKNDIIKYKVARVKKAYPIYTKSFKEDLNVVKNYLNGFSNLKLIGRTATFKYTSSDHYLLLSKRVAECLTKDKSIEESLIFNDGEYAEE